MGMDTVEFGSGKVGFAGLLGGMAIALGLPAIVLIHGQILGPVVQTIVILAALFCGGVVALVGAFFGTVIPRVAHGGTQGRWRGTITLPMGGVKGSGVRATAAREVAPFEGVRLKGSGDVEIVAGTAQSVTVEGDDNLLEYVSTEVSGGTLEIGTTERVSSRVGLKVKIGAPALNNLTVDGSGDILAKDLACPRLAVVIRGSGDVEAAGRVEDLDLRITGSGDADLAELACAQAQVEIAGSGDAELKVEKKLNASILGSGDVRYSGKPVVEKRVLGSGSVRPT